MTSLPSDESTGVCKFAESALTHLSDLVEKKTVEELLDSPVGFGLQIGLGRR